MVMARLPQDEIDRAVEALREGEVVAFPTETVYGLGADAQNPAAVRRVFELKGRPATHPLIVHIDHPRQLERWALSVPPAAQALAERFWPGPLTLLMSPQATLAWDLPSDAPLAVRMPLHPVALALLDRSGPLAVTSANQPGLPAPADVDDALDQLGEDVSLALDAGDLSLGPALPSTVVDVTGSVPRVVRAGEVPIDRLRRVVPLMATGDEPPSA